MSVHRVLLAVCSALLIASTGWAGSKPVAVSPGSPTGALIGDSCPTFSWGSVEGAKSYDLVVYRLGAEGEEAQPVLRETFAGAVNGWTPSLDRCLERGGQYAWSVQAVGGKEETGWSRPSLFEVASGPSETELQEAIEMLGRYLSERTLGAPGAVESPETAAGLQRFRTLAGKSRISSGPEAGGATSGLSLSDAAIQFPDSSSLVSARPCPCLVDYAGVDWASAVRPLLCTEILSADTVVADLRSDDENWQVATRHFSSSCAGTPSQCGCGAFSANVELVGITALSRGEVEACRQLILQRAADLGVTCT